MEITQNYRKYTCWLLCLNVYEKRDTNVHVCTIITKLQPEDGKLVLKAKQRLEQWDTAGLAMSQLGENKREWEKKKKKKHKIIIFDTSKKYTV